MTRSALLTSTAIVAVLCLAACQNNRPREAQGTPVQPVAEAVSPAGGTSGASVPPGAVGVPTAGAADSSGLTQSNAQATVAGAPVGPAVNWRSGIEGNIIWVEIVDTESFYRVDRVSLVAPDGQAFPSSDVNRTQANYDPGYSGGGPTVGLGVGSWSGGGWDGGGTSTGLGISVPFSGGGGGGSHDQSGTQTVARFQLADTESYSRTVANWAVHVRLIDKNGHPSVARFPAPAPIRYEGKSY